jgi:hypothetical protein
VRGKKLMQARGTNGDARAGVGVVLDTRKLDSGTTWRPEV